MAPLVVHTDHDRVRLADKVAFLSSPAAYPERPARVEAVETHMAWVFLTDRHVYKLKKPVRTPVLDFSTVEKRRVDCEEEARLNRRLASDVYLGVVPLVVSPGGALALGRPGDEREAVDWLVHMRRLPADRMLDALLRRGALREGDLRRFAEKLARFYRGAPPVGMAPDAYRRRYLDDVEANRRALGAPAYGLALDLVERTAAAQRSVLEREPAVIEARAARVVEAHGDLRPEHISLVAPEPVVFDCLEFNRPLRLLDPADELAFLSMECARLGAPEVERVLFDVYASVTGDRPPERLVRFYEAYRACLRARLCVWHLEDPDARAAERWVPEAEAYLRLAAALLA